MEKITLEKVGPENLSDHYVSKGRFKNLLQKEILKQDDRRGMSA